MVLRNVPSTATFEEQRVEINELAVDVEALDAAALKAESDTLQTVTGRGFTTTNPIKIENNAATAFVVEDGSSNEKFVVDSVNGKINVGSSAGGASGIYLFHNNAGATPAITLDGATGSITNKGQLVTESILSSAALNNKGSVQFGTVDAYSIGHMPLNSNLAFSQIHGGSYLFYSDASTVELEIASGGITVDGTGVFGGKLQSKNSSDIAELASGANTGFRLLENGTNANVVMGWDGSATFSGVLRGDQRVVVNGAGGKSGTQNTFLNYAGDGSTVTVAMTADGAATFNETLTIGSGSAAPDDYGLIAYANANTLSNKSAVYARNLADGRNFTGDNAAGATTFELYASGLGNFGAASNSTGNNGVQVGGNSGYLNIYTDRYSTDCFQILNTSGSGANIALKAYGNGDLEIAGIIQSNTKSAGNIELDSTGAFTSPKLKLFANTGDIAAAGALTFTGQTSTAASGASSTSDALDHYEEGTWTPAYEGGGTFSCTYAQQTGHFTRIGRVVYVHGVISTASVSGTGSGPLKVAGLPFTVTNGRQPLSIRTVSLGGGTFDQTPQSATFEDGNDHFELLKGSNNGTTDYVADSMLTANNQNVLYFSGFYTV